MVDSPAIAAAPSSSVRWPTVGRWWAGALLLFAGLVKSRDAWLWKFPRVFEWHFDVWVWVMVACVEVGLGLALLAGVAPRLFRWVVLALFVGFLGLTISETVKGETMCGCIGRWSPPPWVMALVDAATLWVLWRWKPQAGVDPDPWRLTRWAAVLMPVLTLAIILPNAPNPYPPSPDGGRGYGGRGHSYRMPPPFPGPWSTELPFQLGQESWRVILYRDGDPACLREMPRLVALAKADAARQVPRRWAFVSLPLLPGQPPPSPALAERYAQDDLLFFGANAPESAQVPVPAQIDLDGGSVTGRWALGQDDSAGSVWAR